MTRFKMSPLVWCVAWLLFQGAGHANEPSAAALIEGVNARGTALFSGRIMYRLSSGSRPSPPDQTLTQRLVFSGASWRNDLKIPLAEHQFRDREKWLEESKGKPPSGTLENINVSQGGKSIEYRATPQLDGTSHDTATVRTEKALRNQDLEDPPVFAGTFWYDRTREYIVRNKALCIDKGESEANGIKTRILEWAVSREESYKAFQSVGELTTNGGVLRVHVAPQLGFVLPRVEQVGAGGKVAKVYEASGFVERGGIYIPNRCSTQYFNAKGPGFYLEYELLEVKSINEPIPDKEFVIELPAGTVVSDARSGTHSTWFVLKDEKSIPPDLVDVIALSSPWAWKRTSGWAIGIGVAVGVAILLLVVFLRRRAAAKKEAA